MPANVVAGDYVFGRRWEQSGVLKPPEWRRRICAVECFIGDDKTRFAILRPKVKGSLARPTQVDPIAPYS